MGNFFGRQTTKSISEHLHENIETLGAGGLVCATASFQVLDFWTFSRSKKSQKIKASFIARGLIILVTLHKGLCSQLFQHNIYKIIGYMRIFTISDVFVCQLLSPTIFFWFGIHSPFFSYVYWPLKFFYRAFCSADCQVFKKCRLVGFVHVNISPCLSTAPL